MSENWFSHATKTKSANIQEQNIGLPDPALDPYGWVDTESPRPRRDLWGRNGVGSSTAPEGLLFGNNPQLTKHE